MLKAILRKKVFSNLCFEMVQSNIIQTKSCMDCRTTCSLKMTNHRLRAIKVFAVISFSYLVYSLCQLSNFRKTDTMSNTKAASSPVVVLTEEKLLKMLSKNCSASIDNNYQIKNDDGSVLSMKEYKAFQAEKFIKENAIPFPDKKPLPPLILNKVSGRVDVRQNRAPNWKKLQEMVLKHILCCMMWIITYKKSTKIYPSES